MTTPWCMWCAERGLEHHHDPKACAKECGYIIGKHVYHPTDPAVARMAKRRTPPAYPAAVSGKMYAYDGPRCAECQAPVREGLVVCSGLSECWRRYTERETQRKCAVVDPWVGTGTF